MTDVIEIVAPLGILEHLEAAASEGASAMYAGVRGHSSRPDAFGFEPKAMSELVGRCHERGLRLYIALNAEMRDHSGAEARRLLQELDDCDPDAIIIGDLGVIHLASTLGLYSPLHASSLLGVMNSSSVRTLRRWGICRVILPTGLLIQEIAELTFAEPNMEFELIVEQGVCFQDSWRCNFPHQHLGDRFDVACKHLYSVFGAAGEAKGLPGLRLWAPDIDAAALIPLLVCLGVSNFKVEGRTQDARTVGESVRRLKKGVHAAGTPDPGKGRNLYPYMVHPSYLFKEDGL